MRSALPVLAVLLPGLLLLPGQAPAASAVHTALDDYVAAPDPTFSWSLKNSQPMYGMSGQPPQIGTIYNLQMFSQLWRSPAETNKSTWTHWLHVAVPDNLTTHTALLVVEGGSVSGTPLDISDYAFIASFIGCPIAYLEYVPNEPMRFAGESFNRTEDSIIAYTYDKYLDLHTDGQPHPDPSWPLLLPMVKSAVRAMDVTQAVAAQQENFEISSFVVGGASKRGWTTWLTAAVDSRVVGIVPIVIDVLNMRKQMVHHKNAYSGYGANDTAHHMFHAYSDAIKDYSNFDIFDRLETAGGRELARIVDPLTYRDRLTMPKLIINSTGDQFFLPDGVRFYYDYLPGQNHILYRPNSDHGLSIDASDVGLILGLMTFVKGIIPGSGVSLPEFDWSFQSDGSIRVATKKTPTSVTLWQASNSSQRDFRLQNVGAIWTSSPLDDPDHDGVYIASVPTPASGWTGFYVNVNIDGIESCSALRVLPDTYPNGQAAPDYTAPAFTQFVSTPAVVRSGSEVTLAFAASESLASNPEVTVNGHDASFLSADGQNYTYRYICLPTDAEGAAVVLVSGTDLHENPGRAFFESGLDIDNTPPGLLNFTVEPSLARPGQVVHFTIEPTEALLGQPTVTVNGKPTFPYAFDKADSFDLAYSVSADDAFGAASIQVTLVDLAGNQATLTQNTVLALAAPLPLFLLPAVVGASLAGLTFLVKRRRH